MVQSTFVLRSFTYIPKLLSSPLISSSRDVVLIKFLIYILSSNYRSGEGDADNIDLQRQLNIVEQEASVLRARISSLESENEKLSTENKQLSIAKMSKKLTNQTEANLKGKVTTLEKQLADARKLVISSNLLIFIKTGK